MKNIKTVPLDELQTYISNGIILLPAVEQQYFEHLEKKAREDKISLLPVVILNRYNHRLRQRIA